MGNEPNRKDTKVEASTQARRPNSLADQRGQPHGPKTSSLAPVAAEPPAEVPREPKSPDLLPRIVSVTLALAVLSLVAIYAIRRPPRTETAAASGWDVEAVAGTDETEGPDWLQQQVSDFSEQWTTRSSGAEKTSDVGVRMGATAAGAAFDMETATRSLDAAQLKANECWQDTSSDKVTISVRFIPEGLAIETWVTDRAIVGEEAASCFEFAFRHATVPAFVGDDTTIVRTLQRPTEEEEP